MKSTSILGLLVIPLVSCQAVSEFPHREQYALLRSVKPGWREAEVRAKLGVPNAEFRAGTPPSVYCMKGRSCQERPITGKLLIYVHGEPTGYYFFDAKGQVEYVFVGGS